MVFGGCLRFGPPQNPLITHKIIDISINHPLFLARLCPIKMCFFFLRKAFYFVSFQGLLGTSEASEAGRRIGIAGAFHKWWHPFIAGSFIDGKWEIFRILKWENHLGNGGLSSGKSDVVLTRWCPSSLAKLVNISPITRGD